MEARRCGKQHMDACGLREGERMDRYFTVSAEKYGKGRTFDIVRPASLDNPKDNAVMFILDQYMAKAKVFETVKNCLVFWPGDVEVPEALQKLHVVVPCADPHGSYCRFFQDNGITYLPDMGTVQSMNGAWIDSRAVIGRNPQIFPGVYIGGPVRIGNNVFIGAGTKIVGEAEIGDNVVIRENTVIGADGLTTDRDGDGKALTMPQFGKVVLEDDVQVGANVVIARGAIDETRICRGAKIDNCAFISHNVTVGEDTFVVGEAILFGSSSTGKRCLISGNATVMNLVHVGDDSIVGAGAVVVKSVPEKSKVKGSPAR